MARPTAALTGGTGYVGSRIAQALRGVSAVVPLRRRADHGAIRWDFESTDSIADELSDRDVSVLVHCAWDFRHPKPGDNWKVNVEGSRKLLLDALEAGVQRIVFISTISAFEDAKSEYGKSKLAVEKLVADAGGVVIRPGLVWGNGPGGMFGSLRKQTAKGGLVPMIGDGQWPQYLVHEDDLAAAVLFAATTDQLRGRVLTVANPQPWTLRALIEHMAAEQGRTVRLVGVPWRLVYSALRAAEALGLKPAFRSDSLLSLVYQDPSPHFATEFPLRAFQ